MQNNQRACRNTHSTCVSVYVRVCAPNANAGKLSAPECRIIDTAIVALHTHFCIFACSAPVCCEPMPLAGCGVSNVCSFECIRFRHIWMQSPQSTLQRCVRMCSKMLTRNINMCTTFIELFGSKCIHKKHRSSEQKRHSAGVRDPFEYVFRCTRNAIIVKRFYENTKVCGRAYERDSTPPTTDDNKLTTF